MSPAFKAYFRDHFRSKTKLLICLVVFALMLTLITAVGGQRSEYTYTDYETDTEITRVSYDSCIDLQQRILIICSFIIPVIEFSFFKKRRNLDCAYALPISRREMGAVHYLTGLICLIVPFTCSYLCNFLLMLRYPEGFAYAPLLGFYFLNLLLSITVYSLFVFVFNQANSTGDGIWFIILWSFLLALILAAVDSFSTMVYDTFIWEKENSDAIYEAYSKWSDKWLIDPGFGLPWGLQYEMSWVYEAAIEKANDSWESRRIAELWKDSHFVVMFAVWILGGIGSAVSFVLSFGKRRAEKTQEVSDSWFGFKVLIPVYGFLINIASSGVLLLGVTIMTFVGYLIYRKGFHLKVWDWIMMGLILIGSVVLLILLYGLFAIIFH